MRDIPFSDEEKRAFMYQLLQALAYMEKVGVMHRDIKPDNIMLKFK
jgi:serine/threonine protein kinase